MVADPALDKILTGPSNDMESGLRGSVGGSRMPHVDGLRAIAMLMVLLGHAWLGFRYHLPLVLFGRHTDIASGLCNASMGVPAFLALSGFCLFYPFVVNPDRKQPSLADFWKRRVRRIIPPYYATLIIFGGIALLGWQPAGAVPLAYMKQWYLWHLPLLHNLRPDYAGRINDTMWSMGLEWQLYLFYPLLFVLYRRLDSRFVLLASFLITLIVRKVIRESCGITGDGDDINLYVLSYSAFGRIFDFSIGMYVATKLAKPSTNGYFRDMSSVERVMFVGATLVSIALLIRNALQLPGREDIENFPLEAAWVTAFSGLILWTLSSRPLRKILENRVLVFLGVMSYSVYLLQGSILWPICRVAKRYAANAQSAMVLEYGIVIPVVIVLGYVFHLAYERPFMTKTGSAQTDAANPASRRTHAFLFYLTPFLLAGLMTALSRM